MFTHAQLIELRQSSIARIICDNSDDIRRVQADVFKMPSSGTNGFLSCDSEMIPHVNLQHWTECCDGKVQCRLPSRPLRKVGLKI